jgi:hypothetical protein
MAMGSGCSGVPGELTLVSATLFTSFRLLVMAGLEVSQS